MSISLIANYDTPLNVLHHKLEYETIFATPSLIGSINDRILLLTIGRYNSSHGVKTAHFGMLIGYHRLGHRMTYVVIQRRLY